MNAPDDRHIGPLARRDGEPAFDEPWQAQVLALAFALSKVGVFTPVQWSAALGRELRRAVRRAEPDDQTTYYAAALAALEGLIATDGRVTPDGLSSRIEQWRCAHFEYAARGTGGIVGRIEDLSNWVFKNSAGKGRAARLRDMIDAGARPAASRGGRHGKPS